MDAKVYPRPLSWIKLHLLHCARLEAEVAKQKETITRLRQDIKASFLRYPGESVKAVKDQLEKEAELNEFLATQAIQSRETVLLL